MTETERLRAEMEAVRLMLAALFQTLPAHWKESVQANLTAMRRHSNAVQSAHMSAEMIELMEEMLLGLTWNPPDVSQ